MVDPAAAMLLAEARVSHLATVGAGGVPHVVPICHVVDGDRIVFATEAHTRKVRNLRANPRASICVDVYEEDWDRLAQVVVHGSATVVADGEVWERGRRLLYEKFPQYEAEAPIEPGSTVIVEVAIEGGSSSGV